MTDIVKLYNPANAATLSQEQLQGLQELTVEQIKELAKAYPNAAHASAYLLIIDKSKPADKQLPSLSSFENLYNLIVRNGLKTYAAWGFKGNYKPAKQVTRTSRRPADVLDLQDAELMHLPGFKADKEVIPAETVPVVKLPIVKKEAKPKKKKKTEDNDISDLL